MMYDDDLQEPTLEEVYEELKKQYARLQQVRDGISKDAVEAQRRFDEYRQASESETRQLREQIRKMEKHIDTFEKWIDRLTIGIAERG